MKRCLRPSTFLRKCAALAAAVAGLAGAAQANPNLTNGLIAYWPFDDTNNGASTPDVQNGYDLFPRSGANVVGFASHINVVPGMRGNAVSFDGSKSTLLAYISPANQWGTPSTQLPPSQYPNWTLSFWIKGTTDANSGGAQRAVCLGCSSDSSPLWDFAVGGQNSTTAQQIDQFIRMNGGNNGQGTIFINATGGSHRGLNANWLDGSWHNITETVEYVTNYPAPVIGPFSNAVAGMATIYVSNTIPLDTLAANETNQVDTNQQYLLAQSSNLSASRASRWTTVAAQATPGWGSLEFDQTFDTNQNTFFAVVAPGIRMQEWKIYMDGTLVGDSFRYNANNDGDVTEPLGAPVLNNGTTSVNYLQNYGNHPGGSDPDAIQPPLGVWKMDTIAFGGISRNGGTGSYITAAMDDAAVWKRALSPSEIQDYMADGITNPVHAIPLQISLTEDFPTVAAGDTENLSWAGAKDGNQFTLNPGGVDETAATAQGIGKTSVVVNSNTTFTIVETRGVSSVNASQSVNAAPGVAANWHYIDSFTYLPANKTNGVFIAGQPASASGNAEWVNPPNGFTLNMLPARVYSSSVDSNNYMAFDGQVTTGTAAGQGNGALAGRHLNGDSIPLGASNTLFFRFYIDPSVNNPDTNQDGQIPDVNANIGLTDKGFRDIVDFDGQNGNNTGPAVFIVRATGGIGGPIDLKAADGSAAMGLSPAGYSYVADTNNGDANGLAVGKVYSVWIDAQNNDAEVAGGLQSGGMQTNGAYYTVWLQREDWPSRTNLFQYITATNATAGVGYPPGVLVSDRDDSTADNIEGPTDQVINGLFLAASAAVAPTETNTLRFDDFYLSKSGYNSTVPVTGGSLKR